MQQCIKLLKKINPKSAVIEELTLKQSGLSTRGDEEAFRLLENRLELDKIKDGERRGEDKIVNMLLNAIEYSYLNQSPKQNKYVLTSIN